MGRWAGFWTLGALAGMADLALSAPAPAADADLDAGALANPAAVQELPQVIVIGNTPLPGFGLPLNQIPSNVQTATSADIQRAADHRGGRLPQ